MSMSLLKVPSCASRKIISLGSHRVLHSHAIAGGQLLPKRQQVRSRGTSVSKDWETLVNERESANLQRIRFDDFVSSGARRGSQNLVKASCQPLSHLPLEI